MSKDIKELESVMKVYDNKYETFMEAVNNDNFNKGIYALYNKEIFEAVYSTNVLMRICDSLITKPSELAYYPIPKLMIQRVGGLKHMGQFMQVNMVMEHMNVVQVKKLMKCLILY